MFMLNSWQESTLLISTLEWISLSGACKLRANKTQMYQPVVRSAPATADHLAVPATVVSRLQVLLRPCLETGRFSGLRSQAPLKLACAVVAFRLRFICSEP